MRDKDTEGARKAMEELLALQQEHGIEPNPEDYFRYAQVWSAAGGARPGRRGGRALPADTGARGRSL